jgi:hypothetical protein
MNPNYNVTLAFILGIILRIVMSPWILGFYDENYSMHKNKIYDSLLFGSMAGLIQIMIDNGILTIEEKIIWFIFFVAIFIMLNYIIHKQIFVEGKDLLLNLRESYAESIKITDIQLENKNIDDKLKNFLEEQNNNKRKAISTMNTMLKEKTNEK